MFTMKQTPKHDYGCWYFSALFLLVAASLAINIVVLVSLMQFIPKVEEKFNDALDVVENVSGSVNTFKALAPYILTIEGKIGGALNGTVNQMSTVIIQNVQSLNATLNGIASKLSIFLPG